MWKFLDDVLHCVFISVAIIAPLIIGVWLTWGLVQFLADLAGG